jgi:hypothetical protein
LWAPPVNLQLVLLLVVPKALLLELWLMLVSVQQKVLRLVLRLVLLLVLMLVLLLVRLL